MLVGGPSYWFHALGGLPSARPALPGSVDCDVAIVGAGYTGLWTAYYLKRADPTLRIVVLEQHVAGYGASGRNGGWCAGELAGNREAYARGPEGRPGVTRALRAMFDTVDEVGRVASAEGIDCDYVKGGCVFVAANEAQLAHLRSYRDHATAWGLSPEDDVWLEPEELAERHLRVDGARAGMFTPHCARIQPAKLVRGLADVVERMGVMIYEGTTVSEILPRLARTAQGDVHAPWVVRATEGYTARLRGHRRDVLPMNSSMIITAPLPRSAWDEIGWDGMETLGDTAHTYIYAQRTADGRIAIGGRGVPYRFGSGTDNDGEIAPSTVASLERRLHAMFPTTRGVAIDHGWSGVLGVPRDWSTSVGADPATGLAWAGCYVGVGVAAANLSARIIADLVRGERSDITTLPFVQHVAKRRWEPEPIRWLSVNGMYALYRRADVIERRTGRPSPMARLANALTGRH